MSRALRLAAAVGLTLCGPSSALADRPAMLTRAHRLLAARRPAADSAQALALAEALREAGLHSAASARYVALLAAVDPGVCSATGGGDAGDCGPRANGRSGSASPPGSRVGTARGCSDACGRALRAAARLAELAERPWYGPVDRLLDDPRRLQLGHQPAAARRRLLHRAARHRLRQGRLEPADRLLRRLTGSAEALYLRALIALRRGQPAAARRLLGRGQRLARRAAGGRPSDLEDLVLLARARLTANPERAAGIYRQVAHGSPWFFRARQELAWTALAARRPVEALAQSAVLGVSGLGRRYFRPDGPVVEAAALLSLCRPAEASARARRAERWLERVIAGLVTFLRQRRERRLYYLDATASIAGHSRELDREVAQTLLADPSFRRAVLVVGQLQRERGLLYHGHKGLRALLAAELDRRLVAAQQRAGEMVQRLLSGTLAELRDLRLRCQEIRFEARRPASVRRPAPARGAKVGSGAAERGGRWQVIRWPLIRGELWPDELGRLRVAVPSACAATGRVAR